MTRVLIVDDHAVVRRGLEQTLAEELPGAVARGAGTAAEALELLGRERFELALVDLNLPGRDGLSLLEEIRRLHPQLPTLVVSAYPEEEFAVRCLRLGAAGYLTKVSAADELGAAARKALAGGKYVTASLAEKLAAVVGGDAARAPHEALSTREMQVLKLVASGRSLKEIAAELHLSEKTIATYRARLSEKLQVSSNVDLTRYALRNKLVE
jgi:DNA-binding NarL/FixJ family response regulator